MIDRSGPSTGPGDVRWTFGRAFPAVAAMACATAGTWYETSLVAHAHIYRAGDLSAGEGFAGAVRVLLTVLALAVTLAGPVALTLYDLATQGTPDDCVLPWWPAWLPS
ncbi:MULTISPECIES: hypothetical protein [unclassified Nonomuraea]|uniref:hypothetical protein n=1 Tax=unclassified Nonomuraea TaxID=2593643 RepID=UPI0033F7E19F